MWCGALQVCFERAPDNQTTKRDRAKHELINITFSEARRSIQFDHDSFLDLFNLINSFDNFSDVLEFLLIIPRHIKTSHRGLPLTKVKNTDVTLSTKR